MGDPGFKVLQALFSPLWHCRLSGFQNMPRRGPAVFVSNHLGSFAPVAVMAALPLRLYPWVDHQITEMRRCPDYLRGDFIGPELHLGGAVGLALASLVAPPCVGLMKAIGAVPVYKQSPRLARTMKLSLALLERGECLVIFPENKALPYNRTMNGFDDGFIGLASLFHKRTGRALDFYPVATRRETRAIRVGAPIAYDPRNSLAAERMRITRELQERIARIYEELA
jgi:1-acyl-sn-glycerol-3-phosphate acyltransferase